jgi:pSer/pThr/pTyr-binding forkhead associated (FHA) protein
MLRVIVSVKRKDEGRSYDLEVPAEIPMIELSQLVAEALNWPNTSSDETISYFVYASPPGRRLRSNECLADAEVWDGAELTFEPSAQAQTLSVKESHGLTLISRAGNRYVVNRASCVLGRRTATTAWTDRLIDLSQENNGKSVSRRHAQLELVDDNWQLSVLHGENNRTIVNGDRLAAGKSHILKPGDELTLGKLDLYVAELNTDARGKNTQDRRTDRD